MQRRKLKNKLQKMQLMPQQLPLLKQQEKKHWKLKRKREKKNMRQLLRPLKPRLKQQQKLKLLIKEELFLKRQKRPKQRLLKLKLQLLSLPRRKNMTD